MVIVCSSSNWMHRVVLDGEGCEMEMVEKSFLI